MNRLMSYLSIKVKSNDQESPSRLGTFLMVFSGLILYFDKIILIADFQYPVKYYETLEVFVWTLSQTLSPFLIIFASTLKYHKLSVFSPLLAFSLQLTWVLSDVNEYVNNYQLASTLIFTISVFYFIEFLRNYKGILKTFKRIIQNDKNVIKYLNRVLIRKIDPLIDSQNTDKFEEIKWKAFEFQASDNPPNID